ncbi:hypothetical protein OG21DRAFT_115617 [Imleria badia]|nr:hypothetical protein OG21DRAFT_115617 [Imleria badia]
MERNPGRLIDQLQGVQARQRKVIQQLQAENARRVNDLADVRQERDAFRKETARLRKENAELQNELEQVLTEYQDLKRERAALARSVITAGHAHGRHANLGLKISSTLFVVNEEQPELSPMAVVTTEKAACPELPPYLHRALPEPPKSESPRPNHPMTPIVRTGNNPKSLPRIQTALRKSYNTTL